MKMQPPTPVCKALLTCRAIVEDSVTKDFSLIGLVDTFTTPTFPAGMPLGVFSRWTSAHGDYQVEVQLRTMDGEVVWRDGPPEPWSMPDPLRICNIRLNVIVVFPSPGKYELVLLANGTDVERQVLFAQQRE